MRKLTRKSLDELAKIYPALSDEEQRGYVAGTSPTGNVTGTADVCGLGGCEMYHSQSEHYLPPVVVTPGGSGSYNGGGASPSGISPTGNFSDSYYNGVNYGLLNDDYNNDSNSSSSTTYPVGGGGGGGGSNAKVTVELMDQDKFVGYSISRDCMAGAIAIMKNYETKALFDTRIEFLTVNNIVNTEKLVKGIQIIDKNLNVNKPVIAGVRATEGSNPNEGQYANHFVVITGRGQDSLGTYYVYMETGLSDKTTACNTQTNRFYYNESTNIWEDNSTYDVKRKYYLTEVRDNL